MHALIVLMTVILALPAAAQVQRDDPGAVQDINPDDAAQAEQVAAGGRLAEAWCAECHALAPDAMETTATTDAAPPMARLARLDDAALRAFLSQPHPPMPPLVLANDEIDDLIAFLGTLRRGDDGL